MKRFLRFLIKPFPSGGEWREWVWPLSASALSGLLFRLAFPPFSIFAVAWFALAPFLLALPRLRAKGGGWAGFFFGLCFFYPNLTWLNNLSQINPMAPIGIFLMAVICAFFPAAYGALQAGRHTLRGRVLDGLALWIAMEWVRNQTQLAFPWFYLGHTQASWLPFIQSADLFGVLGISGLVWFFNATLAETVRAWKRRNWRPAVLSASVLLLAWGLNLGYGFYRLGQPLDARTPAFRIGIIQPGVPQDIKYASYNYADPERAKTLQEQIYSDFEAQIVRLREQLEAKGSPLPDLYVLPESAVVFPFFNLSPRHRDMTQGWAIQGGAPVFFGANRFEPDPNAKEISLFSGDMFNSAFLSTPEKGLQSPAYDKRHLVPFGEYGSYLDIIPGFTEYILGIGNFTPGKKTRVFEVKGVRFGCGICFESCFPYLFRSYLREGVDYMTILTNDAWYRLSSGGARHHTQSIFRAIESRRPLLRVANTGISCILDSRGRSRLEIPMTENQGFEKVGLLPPSPKERPLYMQPWGEWWAWLCLLWLLIRMGGWMKSRKGNAHD